MSGTCHMHNYFYDTVDIIVSQAVLQGKQPRRSREIRDTKGKNDSFKEWFLKCCMSELGCYCFLFVLF